MSRTFRTLIRVLGVAAVAIPALAAAQPGPQPMRPGQMQQGPPPLPMMQGPSPVTHLINARRELDLSPRQLVQLDSIERLQFAERRQQQDRAMGQRDSLMRLRMDQRGMSPDSLRATAEARMEALRPQMEQARRRDSVTMAAAERILTEPQRQKLREMRAEERGRQRGLQEARQRGARMQGRPMSAQRMPAERMRDSRRPPERRQN